MSRLQYRSLVEELTSKVKFFLEQEHRCSFSAEEVELLRSALTFLEGKALKKGTTLKEFSFHVVEPLWRVINQQHGQN